MVFEVDVSFVGVPVRKGGSFFVLVPVHYFKSGALREGVNYKFTVEEDDVK